MRYAYDFAHLCFLLLALNFLSLFLVILMQLFYVTNNLEPVIVNRICKDVFFCNLYFPSR